MAEKVLIIEIGERITKICAGVNKKTLQAARSTIFRTPEGCVTDGQINTPELLAEALKAELSANGMRHKNVVFTLASGKVAAREIKLPNVKETRIATLVQSNASEYFPVDLSKYHITHSILDHVEKGENAGYRVLVLAAPLSILEGYFTLAKLVGLQIMCIDYCGNSLYRALENKCGEEVSMIVDISSTYSIATFIKGSQMVLQRVLTSGTDEFVSGYMAAAGMPDSSYTAAVQELSSERDDLIYNVLPESDVRESLSRLVSNIARAADYYNSSYWERPLDRIVLTGFSCRAGNLAKYIHEQTTIETVYIDALPGFSSLPAAALRGVSDFLACAGATICPVSLMPPQFMKGKKKERVRNESIAAAVAVLVISVVVSLGISGFAIYNYTVTVDEKEKLESKVAELANAEDFYFTYKAYEDSVTDFRNLAAITASPNDDLLYFIGELERKMPSEIRVLSASCMTTEVSMNIIVGTKEEAAAVIVQLRDFESLSAVDVSAISETLNDGGIAEVAFSVRCTYVDTSPDPDVKAMAEAAQQAAEAETSDANADVG